MTDKEHKAAADTCVSLPFVMDGERYLVACMMPEFGESLGFDMGDYQGVNDPRGLFALLRWSGDVWRFTRAGSGRELLTPQVLTAGAPLYGKGDDKGWAKDGKKFADKVERYAQSLDVLAKAAKKGAYPPF